MTHRAYISNISPSWPIGQQETFLASRVPGWPVSVYMDEIRPRALRDRNTAALEQRQMITRQTSRHGRMTLHVATLAIMAWRPADFRKLLEALAVRRDYLVAHTEDQTFDLTKLRDIDAAVALFPISRTQSGRKKGREVGARVSAEKRNAASLAAVEKIRDRWGMDRYTAKRLIPESGLSPNTVFKILGPWKRAQARRKRNAERARKLQEQDT